ncbi:hypothetical protein [Fodinicola acaciae]|uniref:hypothetical protein n=1 Tax=Fodinicola acaciae TaxID=2681555 RepID=UPI0013D5B920|nr:hypothetical protein [Fodinicola acaciae]
MIRWRIPVLLASLCVLAAAAPVQAMVRQPVDERLSADLSVVVHGTSVPVGSKGKPFIVVATNQSRSATAHTVTVTVSASASRPGELLGPTPYDKACRSVSAGRFACAAGDLLPGTSARFSFSYAAASGVRPHAGAGTVTASVAALTPDPSESNNTDQARIDIVSAGSDLSVRIPDVPPAAPGKSGRTYATIGNYGSTDAGGVRFTVSAPNGSALAGVALRANNGGYSISCPVNAAGTTATCTVGTLRAGNYATAQVTVAVPAGAEHSTTLTGGSGTVDQATTTPYASRSATVWQRPLATVATDDPSDDTDTYACPVS